MSIESEYALSFYRKLVSLHDRNNIFIVQHIETKRLYVEKRLSIFDKQVYEYLKANYHPNIPRVYEIISDDNQLIVIEEYINGTSAKDMLSKHGFLSDSRSTDIIMQLCDVLDWLHNANPPIIHRDIKPENLIITDNGKLKLIDFNAAKKSEGHKTQDTVLIGTAGYAAPEQYGFASSNARTDIYAVGVLLNELLTGKHIKDTLHCGKYNKIIKKCTAFDPSDRYSNIKQLMIDIQKLNKSTNPKRKITIDRTRFIPPGFRSKTRWKMLVGGLYYAIILLLTITYESPTDASQYDIWYNKISMFIAFIATGLFIGNYLDIHSRLPLTSSKNKIIRPIGIAIGAFLTLFTTVIIIVIIEMLISV